jgi:hypothetical protein
MYSPNPATAGIPVYYANYDYEHIIVVPSPASSYPSELAYFTAHEITKYQVVMQNIRIAK